MKRFIYRAKLKAERKDEFHASLANLKSGLEADHANGKIMTLSVFHWNDNLFLYYECVNEAMEPDRLLGALNHCLEQWPGNGKARGWVPMMDIFHYNQPVSAEHWSRKEPVLQRCAKIARLKEEMYSSYIFYHYQFQEEKPAVAGNKYRIIAAHENLLFSYHEMPAIIENPALYKGKLGTNNTPSNWAALMEPHFIMALAG